MITQLLGVPEEQVKVLIKAVDEDGNGSIDIQEFKYFVNRYASMFQETEVLIYLTVINSMQKAQEIDTSEYEEPENDEDGWHWSEKQSLKSDAIKIK